MPNYFYHLLFELYTPASPFCTHVSELNEPSHAQVDVPTAWIPPPDTDIFSANLPVHPQEPAAPPPLTPHHTRSKSKSKDVGVWRGDPGGGDVDLGVRWLVQLGNVGAKG